MNTDLEQLLRRADAAATQPSHAGPADLVGAVRSLARRRRRIVRTTGGASVATAAVIVVLSVVVTSPPHLPTQTAETPQLQPDARSLAIAMADAGAEADAHARMVERLVRAERRTEATRDARAPDPLLAVRREQDRAAFLLVYEADRLARQSLDRARAAAEYRRVLALFPDTPSASIARERLAEIGGASQRSTPDVTGTSEKTRELS